ncbi:MULTISPECIES: glycosyltransferase [unclassified Massilia]|uniref:glycosyltransferase n=1 Tax=unclassified Massilia TaxID=2609279 RepID=UPI00177C86D8|nr:MULTISPECIES: glycosyltransferase [unclassified Massilia]MBD8531262.1 glycosyltransferase [Massilia sp. CFBP 13647]MBD8675899.1 glycosyltransferase [Massilia sp. CFBP 13721]
MRTRSFSIAFIVRDPLPPLRADVATLFGAEMPRHGVFTELVGQGGEAGGKPWDGGGMHVVGSLKNRFASLLAPLWDALGLLRAWRRERPDCIQVRDKVASALLGLLAARLLRIPFVYWMSFPIVEGFEARRAAMAGQRRWAAWLGHALRAALARPVVYRLVLPRADHVFVQSDAMRDWLAGRGIAFERMTPVPMGVDAAVFDRAAITPSRDPRLAGRRVVLYLGRVAQSRRSDFLLDVIACLRTQLPEALLVIAGEAPSTDEMIWMRTAIATRGLSHHVLLTGWLQQADALGYAVRAEVGLSPIPRGTLFDVSSPTKLVEYLALGIPGVANDIPDQQRVIEESGAGLCVPMQAEAFAAATLRLLREPALAAQCAARGPPWVAAHRTYGILAQGVAHAYQRILAPCGPGR